VNGARGKCGVKDYRDHEYAEGREFSLQDNLLVSCSERSRGGKKGLGKCGGPGGKETQTYYYKIYIRGGAIKNTAVADRR